MKYIEISGTSLQQRRSCLQGWKKLQASTQEMNASTNEIESEVASMKEKTLNGENIAVEIKQRAGKLKTETEISHQNAINIYEKTNSQLRESIQKTAAIDEIKKLSQTILQITSQNQFTCLEQRQLKRPEQEKLEKGLLW